MGKKLRGNYFNNQKSYIMRYIEISNIERDLFKPTQIEFVPNGRMFVTERLFLKKVGTDMTGRYILFFEELQYME